MTDARVNNLTILKYYKKEMCDLNMEELMIDFLNRNDQRVRVFGSNIIK